MTRGTSIRLTGRQGDFIEQQVRIGAFRSASEVIGAGLELLEERQRNLQALRAALIEGEESGDSGPLDMEEIKRKARAEVAG